MPCLNEARTLPSCIGKARGFLERAGVAGEVIVADNGSTDGTPEIARSLGVRVVPVAQRGYGAALRAGFEAARGTMRVAVPSATAIALGLEVAFAALFLSLVKWQVRSRAAG
jgi:glycosyltransferase involved in cell wall biosynthesis